MRGDVLRRCVMQSGSPWFLTRIIKRCESPDGKRVVTTSADGAARVWKAADLVSDR